MIITRRRIIIVFSDHGKTRVTTALVMTQVFGSEYKNVTNEPMPCHQTQRLHNLEENTIQESLTNINYRIHSWTARY